MDWSSRNLNLFCLYLRERSLYLCAEGLSNLENLIN